MAAANAPVPSHAEVVFAVHASALAFFTGELSAVSLQRNRAREEALFRFGRGWLRKNWKSHVAPIFRIAKELKFSAWMRHAYPDVARQLFVAFAKEYDPDSSSACVRAMRLDDARKFAMVRKVMNLKPLVDAHMEFQVAAARYAYEQSLFEGSQNAWWY